LATLSATLHAALSTEMLAILVSNTDLICVQML
jgi:hypothetical protein